MTISNPNSMLLWWPVLQQVPGLNLPRTEIVPVEPVMPSEELLYSCRQHGFNCAEERRDDWPAGHEPLLSASEAPVREACARLGYPAFLRTDLTSGKHSWADTCFIENAEAVPEHLFNLVENQALHMWLNRDDAVAAFVVRELLRPDAPFTAFHGLPIGREFRYFIADGHVVCAHAYWENEENIEGGLRDGHRPDWRERLRIGNSMVPAEHALLGGWAESISQALPGAWSVDFMLARRAGHPDLRWWVIDMATAANSWHPEHVE